MADANIGGIESPDYCARLSVPKIKAIKSKQLIDLDALAQYKVDAFLLDSEDPTKPGGTGKGYDYRIAAPLAKKFRVFLAGGLTPDSVGPAIRAARPYAVDVSSGVESSPGDKDALKIHRFIQAARSVRF